ncbi:hypothetical protein [Salinarimonas sp.]|uniref:hypothetical protein n=1 Tax=Salinarimonas sp. TaxID=2766526 RepID=UPI0039197773
MSLEIRDDSRSVTAAKSQTQNDFNLAMQPTGGTPVARATTGTETRVAQASPPSNATVVREHRRMLADLDREARNLPFSPTDAVQSTINRLGRNTGLFETQLSPQQRVGLLRQAYGEAIERFAAGDPSVSRSTLTQLHSGLNNLITDIQTGNARRTELLAGFGAGTAEFVRSTSVGMTAGIVSMIGGPGAGALAGGAQSLATLGAMALSARREGVAIDQLDLPGRLVGDVGNIFTTLAGPALLSFMNLPGAPTANTMRAVAAHMGRQGMIDGGLDGLFTTVSEATINRRPIPEALRAGAVQGAISFVSSGAISGPLGALNARQQTNIANTMRQMTDAEASGLLGNFDARSARSLRNDQPIVYRAINERTGGALDRIAGGGSPSRASVPAASGQSPQAQAPTRQAPTNAQQPAARAAPSGGGLVSQTPEEAFRRVTDFVVAVEGSNGQRVGGRSLDLIEADLRLVENRLSPQDLQRARNALGTARGVQAANERAVSESAARVGTFVTTVEGSGGTRIGEVPLARIEQDFARVRDRLSPQDLARTQNALATARETQAVGASVERLGAFVTAVEGSGGARIGEVPLDRIQGDLDRARSRLPEADVRRVEQALGTARATASANERIGRLSTFAGIVEGSNGTRIGEVPLDRLQGDLDAVRDRLQPAAIARFEQALDTARNRGTPNALPPARDGAPGALANTPATDNAGGGAQPPNTNRTAAAGASPDEPGGLLGPVDFTAENRQTLANILRAPYRDVANFVNDGGTDVSGLPNAIRSALDIRVREGLADPNVDGATRTSLEQALQRLRGGGNAAAPSPGAIAGGPPPALPPTTLEEVPNLSTFGRDQSAPGGTEGSGRPSSTPPSSGATPQGREAPTGPETLFAEPPPRLGLDIQPPPPPTGPFQTIPPSAPDPSTVFPNPFFDTNPAPQPGIGFDFGTGNVPGAGAPRPAQPTGPVPRSQDFGLDPNLRYVGQDPIESTPIFQRSNGELVGPRNDSILIENPGTVAAQGHGLYNALTPEIIGRTRATFNLAGLGSITMWYQAGDTATDLMTASQAALRDRAFQQRLGPNPDLQDYARAARESLIAWARQERIDLNDPSNLVRISQRLDAMLPPSIGFVTGPSLRTPATGMFNRLPGAPNFGEYLELKRDQLVNAGAVLYDPNANRGGRYSLNAEIIEGGNFRLRQPMALTLGSREAGGVNIDPMGVSLGAIGVSRADEQSLTLPAGTVIDRELGNAINASLNNPLDITVWRHAGQAPATEASANLNTVVQTNFAPAGFPRVNENVISFYSNYDLPRGWNNLRDRLSLAVPIELRRDTTPPPIDSIHTTSYITAGASILGNGVSHQAVIRPLDLDGMLNPSGSVRQAFDWSNVGPLYTFSRGQDDGLRIARDAAYDGFMSRPAFTPPSPSQNVWVETPTGRFAQLPYGVVRALNGETLSGADVTAINLYVRERARATSNDTGAVSAGAEVVRRISAASEDGKVLGAGGREALTGVVEQHLRDQAWTQIMRQDGTRPGGFPPAPGN